MTAGVNVTDTVIKIIPSFPTKTSKFLVILPKIIMTSKDFRKTVQTVSSNFQQYTDAMEADVQLLITSMLEVIESKIISLRKLLKLKLCIKKVKSVAGLEEIAKLEECTATLDDKKPSDSLEDLSSMIYEVDKDSLPRESEDKTQTRLMCLEELVRAESLDSALSERTSKKTIQKKDTTKKNRKESLEKYIFMLMDAEHQKNKLNKEENEHKSEHIGDFASNQPVEEIKCKSQESLVCLGKTEYHSILDILNMVLRSYKLQEEIAEKRKLIEKTRTEPFICNPVNQVDERKIASDSVCQQKDCKRPKNRKNCCV